MKKLKWTNWSNSFSSYPEQIITPNSEKELLHLVSQASKGNLKIKLVGSGHSCSKIAETHQGILVSLESYNSVLNFDKDNLKLTVEGGISLKDICLFLKKNDAALSNMGTIDAQSIAGAISTGTHGTGIKFGSLDQQVTALEIITSSGEILKISKEKNSNLLNHAFVGLGALGIISKVIIQCVPFYNLQVNTESISFEEMTTSFDQIKTIDYLRFWWVPHTDKVQLWKADKTEKAITKTTIIGNWIEGILKGNIIHEIGLWVTSFSPKKVPLLNKFMHSILFAKRSYQVGDFHSMFTLDIKVKQSVMEYGVPIEKTKAVISEIRDLIEQKGFNVHMPIELRFAPKNEASLSIAFQRDTCYIGIISYKPFGKKIEHDIYFEKVHQIFKKYKGRPHWAKKHFYSNRELKALYPQWGSFENTKENIDPTKMFENEFLKRIFNSKDTI